LAVADAHLALSYKQLSQLAFVFRDVFVSESACPRVGLLLPASAVFPAALFGCFWAGRTAVPLNFLLSGEELGPIVADAGLDLVLAVRHFEALCGRLPARTVFVEDLPLRRKAAVSLIRRLPDPPAVAPDDTAVILYTSGTTAEPKGVELAHRNLHSNCVDSIASLNIDRDHSFLNILPPFHVFGLTANVLVPVALGATVHAVPRFSPVASVKAVAEKGISVMMAIPSMYGAMLRTKSAKREDFRSIYLAISGGEPLPDGVRNGFEERFGVVLRQGYGLTETSPVVSAGAAEGYKPGTVGKPIRNVEVDIVDPDGHRLGRGQDGEILVRGPNVMKGYYGKPEQTREVIDADGWFHTGDVGRLDEDGFLSITGRAKEMLIIGGENVFPREIEAVLESHEGVIQAAVIGVCDDTRGEAPVAFVIPQAGAAVDEATLRNHARKVLAGYKVPKQVIIREDLPTGPTGKILKRRLPELL
jgi:long-chain acyl-CoA synthetase